MLGGYQDSRGRREEQPNNGTGGPRGNGGQPRDRKQTWRQKLPNITGNSGDNGFAAPIDLFVFNVNVDVTEDAIKNQMKVFNFTRIFYFIAAELTASFHVD